MDQLNEKAMNELTAEDLSEISGAERIPSNDLQMSAVAALIVCFRKWGRSMDDLLKQFTKPSILQFIREHWDDPNLEKDNM